MGRAGSEEGRRMGRADDEGDGGIGRAGGEESGWMGYAGSEEGHGMGAPAARMRVRTRAGKKVGGGGGRAPGRWVEKVGSMAFFVVAAVHIGGGYVVGLLIFAAGKCY